MAYKHPKHRRIPRTLLKIKALRHLENKLIWWIHVLEFVVIMLVAAWAVTTAFFFNFFGMHHSNVNNVLNNSQPTMEKELETEKTVDAKEDTKTVESVDTKSATAEAVETDDKTDENRQELTKKER